MGGGFNTLGQYRDPVLGNIFGPSTYGDTFMRVAGHTPNMALNVGMGASLLSMIPGLQGGVIQGLGNTLGFGALGMAGIPVGLAASALAGTASAGVEQQIFGQQALGRVLGQRDGGGRMGFGASRDAARGFAQMFRDLSSSANMLTNDQELKNLFGKFNDMALMQTVRDAGEVGSRFKKLAETVRDISRDLGSTLEGVLPMFQQHVRMGFTDPDEIRQSMRTSRALQGVGVGASEATVTSLQMTQSAANFAAGGSRKIGALGAQNALGTINVALEQGILTDEDLMDATGQIGERGAADFAQQMMQASRNLFANSGAGNLLTQFLGEVDDRGFTGGIDKEALNRLPNLSLEQITKIAQQKLKGREESFVARMEAGLGADISAQLGSGQFASIVEKIFEDENAASEEKQLIVLKQLTGMRGRSLDQLLKLTRRSQDLEKELARQIVARSIRNRLPSQIEEKFTVGGRLDRAYREYVKDPIINPLQSMFGNTFSGIGEAMDNLIEDTAVGGLTSGLGSLLTGSFLSSRTDMRMGSQSRVRSVLSGENLGLNTLDDRDRSTLNAANRSTFDALGDTNTREGAAFELGRSRKDEVIGEIERARAANKSDAEIAEMFIKFGMGRADMASFGYRGRGTDRRRVEYADRGAGFVGSGGLGGYLSGVLDGMTKEEKEMYGNRIKGIMSRVNERKSALLTLGDGLESNESALFHSRNSTAGFSIAGALVGTVVGAAAGFVFGGGIGAVPGAITGFKTGGAAGLSVGIITDIVEQEGLLQGDDLFGGADFEDNQIQSAFLRDLAKSDPGLARGIVTKLLSSVLAVRRFNEAKTDESRLKILRGLGINANQGHLEGIKQLVKGLIGDASVTEGVRRHRGLLGKVGDRLKVLELASLRDRASDILNATIEDRLSGDRGSSDMLKQLFRGDASGLRTLQDMDKKEINEILSKVGPGTAEGQALRSFFDASFNRSGELDVERLTKQLMNNQNTPQQTKDMLENMLSDGLDDDEKSRILQMGFQAAIFGIESPEDNAALKTANRLGDGAEVAKIIQLVSDQVKKDLSMTQQQTVAFAKTMDTYSKSVSERIP